MREKRPVQARSAPMREAPSTADSAVIDLTRLAIAGDAQATRRLLEMVAPRVIRAASGVMGSRHPDLDDAVQLALIGFVQALPTFRGECHPAGFAVRIAIRASVAARTRARARSSRHDASVDLDTLEGTSEGLAEVSRTVVRDLLEELPVEQAEALALRIVLGWSLQEIAEASATPLNTVRSRLRLAKEALRRRIQRTPGLTEEFASQARGR